MKLAPYLIIISSLFLTCPSMGADKSHQNGGAHWGYTGDKGPAHWGSLSPSYSDCSKGNNQSPINLTQAAFNLLDPINFQYQPSIVSLVNNGHTIQLNITPGSLIKVGGVVFNLLQGHFHSQSEHQLNGKHTDMEMHLVHRSKSGSLAVIGVMIQEGNQQKELAKFWDQLPEKGGDYAELDIEINIASLLPEDQTYYYYMGSLTTPPCSEGVRWFVLKKPISISEGQLATFNRLFFNNFRPVQRLNHRNLYRSN